MSRLFLFFMLAAFATSPAFALDAMPGSLTIVSPPDKSIVENGLIGVVLTVKNNTADAIRITVNKKKFPLIKKIGGHTVCKGISLSEGYNTVRVEGLRKET